LRFLSKGKRAMVTSIAKNRNIVSVALHAHINADNAALRFISLL
jgi:hypothetical protein